MMTRRQIWVFVLLGFLTVALLPAGLLFGSVEMPVSTVFDVLLGKSDEEVGRFIILETRLPALFTALLAGASLSVAGLLMQTCFNNPLAGPSIMGISAGSSLGVALVILALGGTVGLMGQLAIIGGAFLGAVGVLALLVVCSSLVRSADVLLILGILIGYLASSVITLLNYFSDDSAVHSFVIWGMGTFMTVGRDSLPLFSCLVLGCMLLSSVYVKSLNAMLLGVRYAESVGVGIGRVRTGLLLLSGGLTAVVTAWCGPIGFLGLAVPHIARIMLASSNHRLLLPCTALCGAAIGLLCQVLSVVPSLAYGATVPVNAITPLIGVPVIVYVLMRRKKLMYFN